MHNSARMINSRPVKMPIGQCVVCMWNVVFDLKTMQQPTPRLPDVAGRADRIRMSYFPRKKFIAQDASMP